MTLSDGLRWSLERRRALVAPVLSSWRRQAQLWRWQRAVRKKLANLVKEIEGGGGTAFAFPLDVADEEQVKSTFQERDCTAGQDRHSG